MKSLAQMGKFQTVPGLRKKKLECHSLMQGQKNGAFTFLQHARNLLPTCNNVFSYPNFLLNVTRQEDLWLLVCHTKEC